MVIDAVYFMRRIGEDDEQPKDRRFWSALAMWQWRADWRTAEAMENWGALDDLDRTYEIINSL